MSKYPLFDRSRLRVLPLGERVHDLRSSHWLALDSVVTFEHPDLLAVALKLRQASGSARLLISGKWEYWM